MVAPRRSFALSGFAGRQYLGGPRSIQYCDGQYSYSDMCEDRPIFYDDPSIHWDRNFRSISKFFAKSKRFD